MNARPFPWSALHDAVAAGDGHRFARLVRGHADRWTASDPWGRTVWMIALAEGMHDALPLLLDGLVQPSHLQRRDAQGRSLLFYLVRYPVKQLPREQGQPEWVLRMLEALQALPECGARTPLGSGLCVQMIAADVAGESPALMPSWAWVSWICNHAAAALSEPHWWGEETPLTVAQWLQTQSWGAFSNATPPIWLPHPTVQALARYWHLAWVGMPRHGQVRSPLLRGWVGLAAWLGVSPEEHADANPLSVLYREAWDGREQVHYTPALHRLLLAYMEGRAGMTSLASELHAHSAWREALEHVRRAQARWMGQQLSQGLPEDLQKGRGRSRL